MTNLEISRTLIWIINNVTQNKLHWPHDYLMLLVQPSSINLFKHVAER